MEDTATIKDSTISGVLGDSLLITGCKGSGKTRAIQLMIKELLRQGKRICLFDFVGKYREISEEYGKTFLDQVDLEDILNSNRNLIRITFNKDILFFKEKCKLGFLDKIHSNIDYLVVDEAHHLFSRADELEMEWLLNKGIKMVLALETMECFEVAQVLKLKRMMNELMFRQYQNGLVYLDEGEALLVKEQRILAKIDLKEEMECLT